MNPADKRKTPLSASLAAVRLLLLLVVAFCGLETRVWSFAATPPTASGQIAFATPAFIGENHVGVAYDASDSLVAAKTGLNPAEINFSQRTVSANVRQYADDMAAGNWDWSRSGPLRVMERDGQWVSYDNRRLMAAQQAGLGEVPVQVVQPGALMPGSSLTWEQAFTRRFTDPRNVQAGGVVPNPGLPTQPSIAPPRR